MIEVDGRMIESDVEGPVYIPHPGPPGPPGISVVGEPGPPGKENCNCNFSVCFCVIEPAISIHFHISFHFILLAGPPGAPGTVHIPEKQEIVTFPTERHMQVRFSLALY